MEDNLGYKKFPSPEQLTKPKQPNRLKLFFLGSLVAFMAVFITLLVVGSNVAPDFLMTDSYCDVLIENATNQSFINGTSFGLEYAIASLTQEAIQCNTIPIEYANYSYSLIAVECLNLNKTEDINNE